MIFIYIALYVQGLVEQGPTSWVQWQRPTLPTVERWWRPWSRGWRPLCGERAPANCLEVVSCCTLQCACTPSCIHINIRTYLCLYSHIWFIRHWFIQKLHLSNTLLWIPITKLWFIQQLIYSTHLWGTEVVRWTRPHCIYVSMYEWCARRHISQPYVLRMFVTVDTYVRTY